jgi:uncharacterized protein
MAKASTKSQDKKSNIKEKKTVSTKNKKAAEVQIPELDELIHVEQQSKTVDGEDVLDLSVRDKLTTLYSLQTIDTRIDRIRVIRGELPLEVQDLEDEVAGLQTRCQNIIQEIDDIKEQSSQQKLFIKDCIALIKKYEEQQNNVRNNREFDSLNKEIQYQKLEIEHSEKKINDCAKMVEAKSQIVDDVKIELEDRIQDLDEKKAELNDIISETQVDEKMLLDKREFFEKKIDERLLYSYSRLRKNARNGLAVASIERDACGGCFNKIPLQRQFEIKQHKKIIVCEYCGRILVDDSIVNTLVIE